MRLDRGDHGGHHVLPAEQASNFGLEARPGARAELAQQLAIEAGVQSQMLGDRQDHLPVREGRADLFGHVQRGQQGAFLVAGEAGASPLAGKCHKQLVRAVRAADAGQAFVQIAAFEKGGHGALDDRPPETGRAPGSAFRVLVCRCYSLAADECDRRAAFTISSNAVSMAALSTIRTTAPFALTLNPASFTNASLTPAGSGPPRFNTSSE